MANVRMLLLTILLFSVASFVRQGIVEAHVLYIDGKWNDTTVALRCAVDDFVSDIHFTFPNNKTGYAYCIVPFKSDTQCNCSCNSTLTCECNISQDISTKITTLQITDTNLTGMFGWYTCAHGSFTKSIMVTAHAVWLNIDVNDEMIKLSCIPDELTSRIDFYFPYEALGHAYCSAPSPLTGHCNCSCNSTSACKCDIFQDITTKTTTLVLKDKNLTSLFGQYYCVHGSKNKSAMIPGPSLCSQDHGGQKNDERIYILFGVTLVLTALIHVLLVLCLKFKMYDQVCNWAFPAEIQNTGDVPFKVGKNCATCNIRSICAICVTCKSCFCDTCCEQHARIELEHQVCQIQHVARSQKKITCQKCSKLAARVCTKCWKQRCISCVSKDHTHSVKDMIEIYPAASETTNQLHTGAFQEQINCVGKISIKDDTHPVRIYGIAYLTDGTLVAIDKNNKQLICFKSDHKQFKIPLGNEPRSVTAMPGSKIAVTFPYEMEIRIYQINPNATTDQDAIHKVITVTMPDLDLPFCKPFSITYNKRLFAVEVGEGEDGIIIILEVRNDVNQSIIIHKNYMKRVPFNFAYFTGNSIRLALDRDEKKEGLHGRLFLSTMSNKLVSCIDFESNPLWSISIPGPRSIIVPEGYSDKYIFLSSRRCNAIFKVDNNGKYEILRTNDSIDSPRYIALHRYTNTLCVLVKNDKKKDELAFFQIKGREPDESCQLTDTTEA